MALETEWNGNTRLRGRHEVFMGGIQGVKRSLYQIILEPKNITGVQPPLLQARKQQKRKVTDDHTKLDVKVT